MSHRGLTVTEIADRIADVDRALARGDLSAARRALAPVKEFHADEPDFSMMAQAFRHGEYAAADARWQKIMARHAQRLMRERHAGPAIAEIQ